MMKTKIIEFIENRCDAVGSFHVNDGTIIVKTPPPNLENPILSIRYESGVDKRINILEALEDGSFNTVSIKNPNYKNISIFCELKTVNKHVPLTLEVTDWVVETSGNPYSGYRSTHKPKTIQPQGDYDVFMNYTISPSVLEKAIGKLIN